MRPISEVARDLGLAEVDTIPYGRDKLKVDLFARKPGSAKAKLVLVTAINPTPAGEGKTTTSIALAMGMRKRDKNPVLALREPSLGPVFGVKGGGTGGGKASLAPASDINMHFTGDLHAITSAHNLLSAMIDNSGHFAEELGENLGARKALDLRSVTWGRALDMNDRALRRVLVGLGGKTGGVPREERFDITAASEVMAILALAEDHQDLEARLGRIMVGRMQDGTPARASDLGAAQAMTAVLRDALSPNLVQTEEGGAAFVHCGPFANIAHGCNSVVASRFALELGDYAITEAGFGFDLGGEKFLDIKCRQLSAWPSAVVIVATLRALKMHGGAAVKDAAAPNADALKLGLMHLGKHLENARNFGMPAVVAINVFPQDTQNELALVAAYAKEHGAPVAESRAFSEGGEGALSLAELVENAAAEQSPKAQYTYALEDSAEDKMHKIVQKVYGGRAMLLAGTAKKDLDNIRALGFGALPICMAKTQLSLSDDPKRYGTPKDFDVTVREVRLAAGAGFLVALTGDIMTMPGLPKIPSARSIRLEGKRIVGLMQNE
jgi:formate--tetrahydrofolate ligase